jgi:hypothetical protein
MPIAQVPFLIQDLVSSCWRKNPAGSQCFLQRFFLQNLAVRYLIRSYKKNCNFLKQINKWIRQEIPRFSQEIVRKCKNKLKNILRFYKEILRMRKNQIKNS